MKNKNTATVRTAVHGTWVSTFIVVLNRVFGWNISLDDILPYLPLVPFILAFLYRVSLVVSEKFPSIGFLIFGSKKTPNYNEESVRRALDLLDMVGENHTTARTQMFLDAVSDIKADLWPEKKK